MSSKTGTQSSYDSEDGMRTIELHRADSMVKAPLEFIEPDVKDTPTEENDPYSYISSKTNSFFTEIKQMKVEVVMFLYMFSYVLRMVSSTSMIMDKVCLVHLNYSSEICTHLKENPDVKTQVEKLATNFGLGHSLIQMIPSAILGCFVGSWSDKYGRKIPLIIALLGIILDGLGSTFCAAYLHSRVEYYFLPAIFTGMSGGFISVLTVLYSYASDITTFSKRTIKYALMEMAFGLSMPLGQLAGGWIYRWSGYVTVFLVSTFGHVIGLAWVLFVLEETKGLDNKDSWKTKFKSLWSLKPVIDGMKATTKARPNKGREQILLLILSMSLSVLSFASTASINFLYVHHVYDWDNTTYSTIAGIFSVIGTFTMLISAAVFKRIGLGDPTLGIVGTLSLLIKNIGIGLASKVEIFYIAHLAGLLSGLTTLAGRSRISKVTSKNDLGKVFAFLSTAESLLPILATAIISQVFTASLNIYPGLVYLVLGSLLFIPFFVYIWLARLPSVDYEEMHNKSEAENNLESADDVKKIEPQKY